MNYISPPHKVKCRGDGRLCCPITRFGICFWLSIDECGRWKKKLRPRKVQWRRKCSLPFLTLPKRMKVGQKETLCCLAGWEATVLDKPSEPSRTPCELYRGFSGEELLCKFSSSFFHIESSSLSLVMAKVMVTVRKWKVLVSCHLSLRCFTPTQEHSPPDTDTNIYTPGWTWNTLLIFAALLNPWCLLSGLSLCLS